MDKHCRICHNTSCSNHGKNISFLGDGWKCNYIPVPTNADRIRNMSGEELAAWIASMATVCECCAEINECESPKYFNKCLHGVEDWLQQSEEDDHA